jgi:hypothetical protein
MSSQATEIRGVAGDERDAEPGALGREQRVAPE